MLGKLLPKTLFARIILIIIIPTLLAQIVSTYIFYQRHWRHVSTHMSNSLMGDIKSLHYLIIINAKTNLINNISDNLQIAISTPKTRNIDNTKNIEDLENLSLSLKKFFGNNVTLALTQDGQIEIDLNIKHKLYRFSVSKNRAYNSTTYIFIIWMCGVAFIFVIIAILISKQQVRPIIKLSRAMEKYGKEKKIDTLQIEGAAEIRKAAEIFLKMKGRIDSYISERTEMLAGVSHDLRTPLTRIKLQIAMLESRGFKDLNEDIKEMEKMINDYIAFARADSETENSNKINLGHFLANIAKDFNNITITRQTKKIFCTVKQARFKRCILNIIENGAKFAKSQILITYYQNDHSVFIEIEDDGPGVDRDKYHLVFKPFYRIDQERNPNIPGSGLGLSIAKDIVSTHAGSISLSKSSTLGGLKVLIAIPLS